MPRNRRDEEHITLKPQYIEEDYLDVDKPLPGQNYYCVSFVSPEKVLEQKELFIYYHYERAFYQKISKMMDSALMNLIEKSDDGKVDVSDVIKLKKSVADAGKEEDVNFEQFKSKLEDFRFRDEDKVGEVFDKQNNFRTSVRGVKVRGVFDTKREADIRASVLQRLDSQFDVFVGQVGYWCPWDPNPHKIDDIEYTDSNLNKLVKEYKANEGKKDQFYQEQKTQRQKDSVSATTEERVKHQKGLADMREYQEYQKSQQGQGQGQASSINIEQSQANIINVGNNTDIESLVAINENDSHVITHSLDVGNEHSRENTLEQEANILQSDDPWLQRKMALAGFTG
jgi:hypothetical protein